MKVIAFDVFGTVFDMSSVSKEELKEYARHVNSEWPCSPLSLPKHWESLPAHPDSKKGIERLRKKYKVVTCSNGPMKLIMEMSRNAGIDWDGIIPIETIHVYKPNPAAYDLVCRLTGAKAIDVYFVTANPTFGDVEGSLKCGMTPVVIRQPGHPSGIDELADLLQC